MADPPGYCGTPCRFEKPDAAEIDTVPILPTPRMSGISPAPRSRGASLSLAPGGRLRSNSTDTESGVIIGPFQALLRALSDQQNEHFARVEELLVNQQQGQRPLSPLSTRSCDGGTALLASAGLAWLPESLSASTPRSGPRSVVRIQPGSQRPAGFTLNQQSSMLSMEALDNRMSSARTSSARTRSSCSSFRSWWRPRALRRLFSTRSSGLKSRPSWHLDDPIQELEEEETISPSRMRIRNLVTDRRFELAASAVILLNAAIIGIQVDWGIQHLDDPDPIHFRVIEYIFRALFTMELLLHIADERMSFLARGNRNLWWNLFDLFIILGSWAEDFLSLLVTEKTFVGTIQVVRIVRLVRMLRVLRVMRFCKELRDMVQGIVVSLRPLLWCLCLLFVVMVTFGILIVHTVTGQILDAQGDVSSGLGRDELLQYFGGIVRTVYTLYTAITGGMDWGETAELLIKINPIMGILFSIYIAFAILCVLNIVTGVFVENAKNITGSDSENMVHVEMTNQEKRLVNMRKIFKQCVATEGSEGLSERQFISFIKDAKVQAYFRGIGLHLDPEYAKTLFRLMDKDNDGSICQDEFVKGCASCMGNARQLDLLVLARELQETKQLVKDIYSLLGECLVVDATASKLTGRMDFGVLG